MNKDTRYLSMRLLLVLLLLTFHMAVANAQLAPLEIRGIGQSVGYPLHFYLSPFDPNIIVDANGYSPKLPAELIQGEDGLYVREDTTEVVWDFGDGSSPLNTGERIGASHVYDTPGNYTVTVKLLDGNQQAFKEVSTDISVKPGVLRVTYAALPITADEPTRLSFSAATFQRELGKDEKITYRWDFGDGNTREGENLDQVNHTYATSGDYKTSLTVTNNYKSEDSMRITVSVVAANSTELTQTDDVLAPPDVIANQVNLQITGSLNGEVKAASKPIAGSVFLAQVNNVNCKLWINFWDDAQLTHGSLLLNLGVLPGDISNYEFTGEQRLDMYFFPNGKTYLDRKRTFNPMINTANVGNAMHNYGKEAVFRMSSGTIKFTLKNRDYLVGTVNSGLSGHLRPEDEDDKDLLIGATGDFTLDLGSRGRTLDLIEEGLGCIEQDFYETKRYPQARQKHVQQDRPILSIVFNQEIKPDSINDESFQVGYPDADGNFIKVAGKFVNDKKRIRFVPDQALRKGIRYTMKFKIGEQGVLSASGSFIKDQDGSGWQESEFWTQLPFSNDADSPSNLSCDVYQSVKNVPLIIGKPALMKIYADWPKYDDVHASAQYEAFDAMVKMSSGTTKPLGDQAHKFTRPDLREGWGTAKLREEEAAQYPFIPQGPYANLEGHLSVKNYDKDGGEIPYFFNCSTHPWDLAPELKVDVFALNYGRYGYDNGFYWRYGYDNDAKEYKSISKDQTSLVIKRLLKEAKLYAEQVFPVKTINFSEPKFIDVPGVQALDEIGCDVGCYIGAFGLAIGLNEYKGPAVTDSCGEVAITDTEELLKKQADDARVKNLHELWLSELKTLRLNSDAHLIVILLPHELMGGGGHTAERLVQVHPEQRTKVKDVDANFGQGLIYMSVGDSKAYFDRYVFGLVHEIGHALTLVHTPSVIGGCAYQKYTDARLRSESTYRFEEIDGIKLSADGTNWWHKSSRLGNEESKNIIPLMFPATMPIKDAFILRNDYRTIQELFEDLGPEFKKP